MSIYSSANFLGRLIICSVSGGGGVGGGGGGGGGGVVVVVVVVVVGQSENKVMYMCMTIVM